MEALGVQVPFLEYSCGTCISLHERMALPDIRCEFTDIFNISNSGMITNRRQLEETYNHIYKIPLQKIYK